MEPQIIHYYNHKNVLCKICSRKGHTSEYCPNVGMAKMGFGKKKKEEVEEVDNMLFSITTNSFSPKKKRGRKPKKKEGKIYDPISILSTDTDDFDFTIDEDFKIPIFNSPIIHSKELDPEDIDMVVNYTGVERSIAKKMIQENGGDPVAVIMKLPLKESFKKN